MEIRSEAGVGIVNDPKKESDPGLRAGIDADLVVVIDDADHGLVIENDAAGVVVEIIEDREIEDTDLTNGCVHPSFCGSRNPITVLKTTLFLFWSSSKL